MADFKAWLHSVRKANLISADKPNALKALIGIIYLIMYNVNSLCIQCHLLNKKQGSDSKNCGRRGAHLLITKRQAITKVCVI